MNIQAVTQKLQGLYPGKKIVVTDPDNPTEIICEIEATADHPDWSEAIAVIDNIRPHYHLQIVETYQVLKGTLTIYLNNQPRVLKKGESITIPPRTTHWSTGDTTWLHVTSRPGWTPADHILVLPDRKISRQDV